MSGPTEPRWIWETCGRGHPLRLHGRPRRSRPHQYHCAECNRITKAARLEAAGPPEPPPPREPDHVMVRRLTSGQAPGGPVHSQDRYEAVARLYARGWGIILTARQVGTTPRTVARIRRKIRKGIPYGTQGT